MRLDVETRVQQRFDENGFFYSYFQRPDILQSLAEFVLPSDLCAELDFSRLSSSEPREFAANVERSVDDALLREAIMNAGQKVVEQGREDAAVRLKEMAA